MPKAVRWSFGLLITALLVGGPVAYSHFRYKQLRAFRVVREGVLYRSGQLTLSGLKQVLHDYNIKTVITLRDAVHPGQQYPPDLEEERYCRDQELNYFRITPRSWWASDGSVPAEKGIRLFLRVMDDPTYYPVLVHCCAGIHRTGAYCAVYRMEYQRWTNNRAIAEMKAKGYCNIDDEYDLLGYLEDYQPRWKRRAKLPPSH